MRQIKVLAVGITILLTWINDIVHRIVLYLRTRILYVGTPKLLVENNITCRQLCPSTSPLHYLLLVQGNPNPDCVGL